MKVEVAILGKPERRYFAFHPLPEKLSLANFTGYSLAVFCGFSLKSEYIV